MGGGIAMEFNNSEIKKLYDYLDNRIDEEDYFDVLFCTRCEDITKFTKKDKKFQKKNREYTIVVDNFQSKLTRELINEYEYCENMENDLSSLIDECFYRCGIFDGMALILNGLSPTHVEEEISRL